MDKCTFCAGGPEADGSKEEYEKYGANRLAEGKLPLCAEMCSTKSLLAGDGGGTYHVKVDDGTMAVSEGPADSPNTTIKMAAEDYVQMVNGKLSGTMAFMKGKLKVTGNPMLAMKLQKLFSFQ